MTVNWGELHGYGFSVFPLKAQDKRPLGPWEKHQHRRATDEELANWAKRPSLNAAIACGPISGVLVLDTDSDEAEALVVSLGCDRTPTVRTAKGRHRYFRYPENAGEIGNRARVDGIAFDIRGHGGYVVAPGSVHPTGVVYDWEISPAEAPFAEVPAWLLKTLTQKDAGTVVQPAPGRDAPGDRRNDAPGSSAQKYAEKTFDGALSDLRRAGPGTRNDALNRAAFALGQLVGAGLLSRDLCETHLRATALAIGLDAKEVAATMASGLDDGIANPKQLQDRPARSSQRAASSAVRRPPQKNDAPLGGVRGGEQNRAASLRSVPGGEAASGRVAGQPTENENSSRWDPLDDELADVARSDLGNAERLMARHGEDLIYVPRLGWHGWSGPRWDREDGEYIAMEKAHGTAKAIMREAAAIEDRELRLEGLTSKEADEALAQRADRVKKHRGWSVTSQNSGRTESMLTQAKPYLRVAVSLLDREPLKFSVGNGTLDLSGETIRLLEPDRADYITRGTDVEYHPAARCPTFEAFLEKVLPKPEVREFLQRWFGYCMTGLITEQLIVLFHGTGGNGKSTLLEVMAHVLGEYAVTLPFSSLLHNDRPRGSEASPDLARLPGARLVRAAEPEQGSRFSESLLKSLTGGEPLAVRKLHEDFFEFHPTFKLTLSFNNPPVVRGQDEGIWRRLAMVPFEVTVPAHERVADLDEQLKREASGILNWLLEGYALWVESGLAVPDAVRAATKDYRSDMDPLGEFLDACTERAPDERIQAGRLIQVYEQWARENGQVALSTTAFGRSMATRGFEKVKSAGIIVYRGLKLSADAPQPRSKGFGAGEDAPGEDPRFGA